MERLEKLENLLKKIETDIENYDTELLCVLEDFSDFKAKVDIDELIFQTPPDDVERNLEESKRTLSQLRQKLTQDKSTQKMAPLSKRDSKIFSQLRYDLFAAWKASHEMRKEFDKLKSQFEKQTDQNRLKISRSEAQTAKQSVNLDATNKEPVRLVKDLKVMQQKIS